MNPKIHMTRILFLALLVMGALPWSCGTNSTTSPVTNNYYSNPTTAPNFSSLSYSFNSQWGGTGAGAGKFNNPLGVAVHGSLLYVTDYDNNRIEKFSVTGQYMDTFTNEIGGPINLPAAVMVDGSGNIFFTDLTNSTLQELNPAGSPVTSWNMGSSSVAFSTPRGLAMDAAGNIYVGDAGNNRVQKLSPTGAPVTAWTTGGFGPFSYPSGVGLDSAGNIFVLDTNNTQVQKLSAAGAPVTNWGGAGTGHGTFNLPFGLTVDAAGNVYVIDSTINNIQKFDNNGKFLTQWGAPGAGGNGFFNSPQGVAVDGNANVYVADTGNNLIQKFSPLP